MKINKKFLGIILGLGLTFSLSFAASAYTLLPSTDDINISYAGKSVDKDNKHFYKDTDLNDAVALYIIFDRALERAGKQNNELAYEGLRQIMVPRGMFDKNKNKPVCLDSKIPTEMAMELTDKFGSDKFQGLKNVEEIKGRMQEINRENSKFITFLNQEKNNALTKEDFENSVKKIKEWVKSSIDKTNYSSEEEKQKLENILKGLENVKFEDVKDKISKFNFRVKDALKMSDEKLENIVKDMKK